MQRDLLKFDRTKYDLIVVGAGIYGACIARDAAIRGLRVALLERGDFGNATSHNSLKLIHGGLRYLQHFDVLRVRQYIREKRNWLRIAPHLIRPLKFVIPTYGHGTRGREALWAALKLYEFISLDRNSGLFVEQYSLPGGILSCRECLEMIPELSRDGLTGGVFWYDAQMLDANRVLLECVKDAYHVGADVINYLEVNTFIGSDTRIQGVHAVDRLSGTELDILGSLVVNASGPWVNNLLRRGKRQLKALNAGLTKGMNLVTRQIFNGYAAGLTSKRESDALIGQTKRFFFVIPWYDCSVIGTSHLPFFGDVDKYYFTLEDIEQFLCEINAAYPALELALRDVLYCYSGLTPTDDSVNNSEAHRSHRDTIINHKYVDGVDGLISVFGIKYTSARLVAEHVVNLVFNQLGRKAPPCSTATRLLPGATCFSNTTILVKEVAQQLGRSLSEDEERMAEILGITLREVLKEPYPINNDKNNFLFYLLSHYSVKHEMAMHLEDIVLRRTGFAERGKLTDDLVIWCANMMGDTLGWSKQQRADEIAAVKKRNSMKFC